MSCLLLVGVTNSAQCTALTRPGTWPALVTGLLSAYWLSIAGDQRLTGFSVPLAARWQHLWLYPEFKAVYLGAVLHKEFALIEFFFKSHFIMIYLGVPLKAHTH